MPCILNIETSGTVCSVALSQDGSCIAEQVDTNGPSHAVLLSKFVEEMISFADSHAIPIDAVAVSSGPGSYTGLRIGVSTAKGVCYGRNIPLIEVSTLETLCVPILLYEDLPEEALLCPMIDARRMEVYTALYDRALVATSEIEAKIIDSKSFAEVLEERPIYFFGSGAEKCKSVIQHTNAFFMNDVFPVARNMFPLSEKKFLRKNYVDVAYFEPFYLKEFTTTTPKKVL